MIAGGETVLGRPEDRMKGTAFLKSKPQIQSSLVAQTVKNLPAMQETFNPWVEKIPWRKKWQPTPVFLPGKSHGQRSLAGCSPWSHKELDTTDRVTNKPQIPVTRSCVEVGSSLTPSQKGSFSGLTLKPQVLGPPGKGFL